MIERILDRTKILEKSLDAAWTRNEVIAENIANVDTPGYKRKSVAFEEFLSDAMDNNSMKGLGANKLNIPLDSSKIDDVEIKITEDNNSLNVRLDGNNVDIENEMAELAKNDIRYNVLIQRISGTFRSLKSVISEGRK